MAQDDDLLQLEMLRKYASNFDKGNTAFLKRAKRFLPSTWKKVTGLRETLAEEPTESVVERGEIISRYWGQIWEEYIFESVHKRILDIESYLESQDDVVRVLLRPQAVQA